MRMFQRNLPANRTGWQEFSKTSAITRQIRSAENSDSANKIRQILTREMTKSKRTGSWFRLTTQERAIYSLALRLKVTFRSLALLRALTSILRKLKEVGDEFYRRVKAGSRLAWAFSEFAVRCGNAAAKEWRNDRTYISYLATFVSI